MCIQESKPTLTEIAPLQITSILSRAPTLEQGTIHLKIYCT